MKLILIFVLFVALDLIWFKFSGSFFKGEVSSIARLNADGSWDVRLVPAILVYLVMSVGIVWFVLPQVNSVTSALVWGGLFGLVMYGIYDFTNLATLSAWTTKFVVVDILWGTVLCATVTTITYYLLKLIT